VRPLFESGRGEALTDTVSSPGRALVAPRVLMYHFFGNAPGGIDPDHQFVTEQAFRSQLDTLARGGWRPIDLDDYLRWWDGARLPRKSFLLTIDDAHHSVVSTAAPMLAEAGVPAVLFVPSGLVGGTVSWSDDYAGERIATAEELRSLSADIELGVHGYDHTRMVDMDDSTLRLHTAVARDELMKLTGRRARAFAYPYGTHDEQARCAVAAAGYEVAFAVARERGRMGRWRICVDGDDSSTSFRFKLTTAYAVISLVAGRTPGLRHKVRDAAAAVRLAGRAAGSARSTPRG
jgi:peptidoglycan/xylan/chitin deacetylase (PgdA/CDA1 family)